MTRPRLAIHDPYVKNLATTNCYSAANFPDGAFLSIPNSTRAIPVAPGVNVFQLSPA